MKRGVRIGLIVLGLLVVVVIVLPFLVPVNQFRPAIEEKASAALGRKVTFGNLSLSLLGGSLKAEDLSIGEDSKFGQQPFLTAKSLKVGVELVPLVFSKKLNVTGVTIEEPQVTLLRNPQGQWNFASLGGASASHNPETGTTVPGNLSVNKIDLNNGRLIVGSTQSRQRSTYDHVNLTLSDFSATSTFPVTLSAELPGGGKLKLDGKAGPIDAADATLTPLDAKLNVSGLNLATTGFLDSSAGLGGLLDLDATVRSQNGNAETNGNAILSKALLVAGGSPASQPVNVGFNTTYDLRRNAGVLKASTLKIGKAAAQLNGTYNTAGENPTVNLKVNGQNMPANDLASFLPALGINLPQGASLAAGTLNTDLNVSGPTNKLVTTGNVGLVGAKIAGFDLGSKLSAIASLTGIQTGRDLQIDKLASNLRIAPNGIQADNFLAVIPALGSLAGSGTIDAKNNLDFKMAAVLAKATTATGATTQVSPISQAMGMLGKYTGGCKGTTTVPFLIHGTASDPKFVPDVGGLAAGMLKSQLGCMGGAPGKSSGSTQTQPSNPLEGVMGLFGRKK